MTRLRIYAFTCSLLALLAVHTAQAQGKPVPAQAPKEEKAPVFGGIAVGTDLVGFAMKGMGLKFANMEVYGRLNFLEKYYPIVELGIGDCTREGGENSNKFSTTAPYYRVGMDYNFNKKVNGNRFFGGLRYGFTSYKFDFKNPDFTDPVYGVNAPLNFKDLKAKKELPKLYFACGTEDGLIDANRDYVAFLKKNGVECTFIEAPGVHDWNFWDEHIKLAMDWLPLEGKTDGINSGNVK